MTKYITKIAALPVVDGKLLVVKPRKLDVYITLGGKRDPGESDLECLVREVKEEVGCDIEYPTYLDTFHGSGHESDLHVELICYLVELKGNISPQSEIEDIKWVDASFSNLMSDLLNDHVLPALKSKGLL